MAKATVAKGSEYFFEEGQFVARLDEVTEKHVEFTYKAHHKAVQRKPELLGTKSSFDNWEWLWTLLEGPQEGQTITLTTDPKVELEGFSPAKVAFEALQGEPLELDQDIDTDMVVGLKARIVLTHMEADTRGDRTYYNTRVTDVLPLRDGDEDVELSDEPPF